MSLSDQPVVLTDAAAQQVRDSASQSGMSDTPLRFAVEKLDNGQLRYAMGFDDAVSDDDRQYQSNGISILVAESSVSLLQGTTMDYVKLDDGDRQFVFLNPNDPNYSPPTDKG